MSGRGVKGRGRPRGRPPKATSSQDKKFNYNLLKKPKYLQKSDSRFSTPSASRASSPQDSEESSRKSISRRSAAAKTRGRRPTKNSRGGHNSTKKSYSSPVYNKTDYHYGSDFGDSTDKSEDEMQISNHSDSDSVVLDESDSDFSLSSYSNVSTSNRNGNAASQTRGTTPDLVWLKDDIDLPVLELPPSSDDLLVPKQYILKTVGVYEILRRYRNLVRLSPFRIEDFCAALMCVDQSPLLVEIHITLLKAILREEDSQQTHFGPLDQKDSVNIGLYLIDQLTWPEVLRSYVESDYSLDTNVLAILSKKEYPYTEIEDRLAVLQLLTDQFLTTTSVRDDMIQEGPIHYDDHCRICHRLGDLLCCETCPAVFHLECVDPPLTDVPTEDWQCSICKSHSVSGVVDCVSVQEKQGLLCRQEHYGFDRHGRKYWFVCRRLFVETENGSNLWYYTTLKQLHYVMSQMDSEDYEYELHKAINDNQDLIQRQMELTEKITNQLRGNKKSYLETENQKLAKLIGTASRKSSTEKSDGTDTELNGKVDEDAEPKVVLDENMPEVEEMDIEENLNATEINKSKNGTQISSIPASEENNASHLTRSKLNQIANGTLFFKLGMENNFKTYVNQFSVNHNALNKPQKNEERDKKRHLSHKFSLTHASEFKWSGSITGTQSNIIAVLKQTLITFEQQIAPSYMHCNWQKLRKNWLNALTSCSSPDDFAKTLIALQSCFKGVIFANVWHDQLGHTKLYRITAQDREDKKKIEKREKRERDDEEERHRLAYNFVKYSLGLKHQVWKQKGEEYRIHGQWGWLWTLKGRRVNYCNSANQQKIKCIQLMVKHESKEKVISLRQQTFKHLPELLKLDTADYPVLNNLELMEHHGFASIDVSAALSSPTRILFPKVAIKSCLDDLLAKREGLRDLELKQAEPKEEAAEDVELVDPKPVTPVIRQKPSFNTQCVSKILVDLMDNKLKQNKPKLVESEFTETCRRIHLLRKQLLVLEQQLTINKCFSRHCRDSNETINLQSFAPCFSILCLKAFEARREICTLIQDLKDEHNLNADVTSPSILQQRLTEQKNNDFYDILKKFELCDFVSEQHWQNDLHSCLEDLASSLATGVDFDSTMLTSVEIKKEDEMEVDDDKIKNKVLKKEQTETAVSGYVNHPNRRFCSIPKPTKKENEVSKEFDKDGKEKVYSATSTEGKIYLNRSIAQVKCETIPSALPNGPAPATPAEGFKYPIITNFSTYKLSKNIMVLPKYEVTRLARRAGKTAVNGFNHQAKNNNSVWPYPCSRPLFKNCWIYRTFCLNSLSTFALQLRIIWTCMRWDDMATKPATVDGKNQVTTETEIMSLELLKHRQVGMFMERTQYLRRKIVIPLELPKTIREVQSIRSGLRKRKRAESPQQTEPQVAEEWVDEDKLELWEIKQYGEKQDKVVLLPTTRTSTGKLPPQRMLDDGKSDMITRSIMVSSKSTPEQIKEKIEAQLKIQRDAHNKKRAEDMKGGQQNAVKTIRKILVKNPDGTTKIINQIVSSPAPTPVTPKQPEQQKVQIIRGSDGKVSVRGLQPWQQLIQTPDGKLHVIASPQSAQAGQPKMQQRVVAKPTGQAIGTASCSSPSTPKAAPVVIRQSSMVKASFANNNSNSNEQRILNSELGTESPVVNQPQMQRVITSSGQIITQQVQNTNAITTSNLQQLLQRGTIQGQKIIVNPTPVQKLLVSSPTAQNSGEKRFIIQQNAVQQPQQQIIVNQQGQIIQQQAMGQQIMIGNQKILLSPMQTSQTQQIKSPVQQIQMQIQSPEKQVVQQQQTQVVMQNNTNLAQQIATGKVQLATINGQQVLIRQIGNNQAQIIGHVKTQEQQPKVETVVKQQTQQIITKMVQIQPQQQQQQPIQQTNVVAVANLDNAAAIEQSLLQGQPPGTVIKCVTAQVVQTANGPRIVLQGLQGNDFTPAQTALVQQQVKQQLLKAQESNGKQGVLGPTKIYLAIQPAQQSQPPPLTPVMHQQLEDAELSYGEEDADGNFVLTPAYITNTIKTVLKQGGLNPEIEEKLLNLQRYQEKQMRGEPIDASSFPPSSYSVNRDVISPMEENFDDDSMTSTKTSRKPRGQLAEDDDEEWVIDAPKRRPIKMPASAEKVTRRADRDYMAEFKNTIFNDKQEETLNQKVVVKCELVKTEPAPSKSSNIIVSYLKRNDGLKNNANLAAVTGSSPNFQVVKSEKIVIQPKRDVRNKAKENQKFEHESPVKHSKLNLQLHKHKETLKKMILKKRNLLEKELQCEIQKELSMEMASHIKNVHAKQEFKKDLVGKQATKRKIDGQRFSGGSGAEHPEGKFEKPRSSKKVAKTNLNDTGDNKNKKKQKIYCICRKPYDRTKFYIGCDVCNNWFHGECVGVSEDQSKSMTEFVCDECERAKNTQELFCLCRTPYDQALFYICCDKCQDWFHGKCVGILQSEADFIDEYICPNCQKNSSINYANMKPLHDTEFEDLRVFLKDIQNHKSAWPFMDAVDANEVPDYYNVIKDPMDLKQIEMKVMCQSYNCLADFIKDMTKVFDNCRYYNSKDSSFCKCAEGLENYFIQKLNGFRDTLVKNESLAK